MHTISNTLKLLTLALLLLLAFPTIAQDEPDPLQACTPDERAAIGLILADSNAAFANLVIPGLENSGEFSAQAVQYGQFAAEYNDDVYGVLPRCVDGFLLGELTALTYDQVYITNLLLSLLSYETEFGNPEASVQLADALQARFEATNIAQQTLDQVTQLLLTQQQSVFPAGVPECTTEQVEAAETLDSLRDLFVQVLPEVMAYAAFDEAEPDGATSPLSIETLVAVEAISTNLLQLNIVPCDPLFQRGFADSHLYVDTSIMLLLGQVLAYERAQGSALTVDALEGLLADAREALLPRLEDLQEEASPEMTPEATAEATG